MRVDRVAENIRHIHVAAFINHGHDIKVCERNIDDILFCQNYFINEKRQPTITEIRMIATQFSAATGLSVTDTGVVNDANPTSSDAVLAQTQTLVLMAEQLNKSNGDALRTIAQMAMAISSNKKLEELTDEEKAIIAHFKNPAMPSVSVTADAAIKIASSRPEFASTDTFLEMVGFDQADIRRIKAQEVRARGQQVLTEFE